MHIWGFRRVIPDDYIERGSTVKRLHYDQSIVPPSRGPVFESCAEWLKHLLLRSLYVATISPTD